MRAALIITLLCLVFRASGGNNALTPRDYNIPASVRVLQLDTLSIVAESFSIYGPDGLALDPAFYRIDFISTRLELRIPEYWLKDSLRVVYRVWPIDFSAPILSRDTLLMRLPGPGESVMPVPATTPVIPEQGLLQFEGLQSSGSITRGLTMGNRQNTVLNSAMNLQLNGMLSENILINAQISDQNIPFQPEGTTAQLQDFDKVFINISGYGASLTAGDFELTRPEGYFMNVSRRARGGLITYQGEEDDTLVKFGGRISASVSGAIARGKYARNQIQGQEGNQGPYRLQGNENESFILVLSGTERVFIDGRPLRRGMDGDYVIDYNTAEIIFMPGLMITRDSRIVVEFEYAERNYARSMLFSGVKLDYKKAAFRVNLFSEQDHRNQPLFQELSQERRMIMASVGDSIHRAYDWNVDSSGFQNDRVMYRVTDTLGYPNVYVWSTDPEQAHYIPGFSYVGEGNGNYRQVSALANGRVFEWIAPVNGQSQGTYEPVVQLVTPRKHQMFTAGGDWNFNPSTTFNYEYAVSDRDINLYSNQDKSDDVGQAFRAAITNRYKADIFRTGTWNLTSAASYEYSGKQFRPLERYRSVEFERDWNILPGLDSQVEHLPEISFRAENPAAGNIAWSLRSLTRGNSYQGYLNSLNTLLYSGKNRFQYTGSLLRSDGNQQTSFYRHNTFFQRNFNVVAAGVEHQTENRKIINSSSDTLSFNSLYFTQWEFYLTQADTSANRYRVFYRLREDGLPAGDDFSRAARAHNYGLQYQYLRNANQRVNFQLIYRNLEIQQARYSGESDENTINIRGDYFSRWYNGVVTSTLFYETASGRERRREYIYLQVPAGQGAYTWNDYNGNGIMELDEFELSPYPDEADFIRIFIPTDQYVPVYSTGLSHSLNVDPAIAWRNETGLKKMVSRFSNRLNYRVDNKSQGMGTNFNPFTTTISDTLLISLSSSVRNSLFFNRSNPRYSIEWTLQDLRNKNLLSNGFESRILKSNALRYRLNINRLISFTSLGEWGERTTESEFFLRRNYQVSYYLAEPAIHFQPTANHRLGIIYGYQQQDNLSGDESAHTHRITIEDRVSFPGKGSLQVRYQLQRINFAFDQNTPVAFEMLQGLRHGTNHLWNINWQHNINSYLQLSLQYNGRTPPGVSTIHTGSVQLRALF